MGRRDPSPPGEEASVEELREALERAQEAAKQSEKMAALGMLVAGIAHEINTPIAAIGSMHHTLELGLAKLRTLLQAELGEDLGGAKIQKTLKIIEDASGVIRDGGTRVTKIVKGLKSFARLDEQSLEQADINEGIEATLTLIQHEIKRGLNIERDLEPMSPVPCHPGRINQVFLNIMMNAAQAMNGEGTIRIRSRMSDGMVEITVSDTGKGIAAENLERIFEPGFTTKRDGVGTGIGLAICKQIIDEHRGEILVASEVGVGTTFTVRFPADLSDDVSE